MNFQRHPGTVFVTVPQPTPTPLSPDDYERSWGHIAQQIAVSECEPPESTPEPETPSIDAVFAESLPLFIEASRWGRYIEPGPASYIRDNTILVYHNPCGNFWDLYELSKGIFRDLGIRLAKRGATWLAHIPIKVLRDQVFVDSGLVAVENTLMEHTGIDPVEMLREIQQRQFQETQDGIKRVKRNQMRSNLCETVGDAVGMLAITAVSWAAYVVMGVTL